MRKIEEAMCEAVRNRKSWELGNTCVVASDGGNWVKVYLYDNLIYTDCLESGRKSFTLAGWNTATTRSRLRALGVAVSGRIGRDKQASYNGLEIRSNVWYKVNN